MHVSLLYKVKGQLYDETYSKLSGNEVDQMYARLLKTDHVSSRILCTIRCSQHMMCTLFQFKDGQCKLLKQETKPGIGITTLKGSTEVWSVDLGKITTLYHVVVYFEWNHHIQISSGDSFWALVYGDHIVDTIFLFHNPS